MIVLHIFGFFDLQNIITQNDCSPRVERCGAESCDICNMKLVFQEELESWRILRGDATVLSPKTAPVSRAGDQSSDGWKCRNTFKKENNKSSNEIFQSSLIYVVGKSKRAGSKGRQCPHSTLTISNQVLKKPHPNRSIINQRRQICDTKCDK